MLLLIQNIILAIAMAVGWVFLTAQINFDGFLLGFTVSFVVVMLLMRDVKLNPLRLPIQIFALIVYSIILARDIFLSGIDVSQYVIGDLTGTKKANPGIARLNVKDDGEIVNALTAHGITITPGQLVVDYDDEGNVYVHCLDIASAEKLEADQDKRLAHLRRIVGQ